MWQWRQIASAGIITLTFSSGRAYAHTARADIEEEWWWAWQWDELVIINLCLLTFLYCLGWFKSAVALTRGVAFLLGIAAIALALLSPLDTLAEELGWVHMLQHMVLMTIAAPLVVYGWPARAVLWAVPRRIRKSKLAGRLWRMLLGTRSRRLWSNPWLVLLIHTSVLWGWHIPLMYEAALTSPLIHDLEHISMFLAAVLLWQMVLVPMHGTTAQPAINAGVLFITSVAGMVLGVLMALSPYVWYPSYVGRTEYWGWTPMEDQQLAGTLMWVPACAVYAVVAIGMLAVWIAGLEKPAMGCNSAGRKQSNVRQPVADRSTPPCEHPTRPQCEPQRIPLLGPRSPQEIASVEVPGPPV
jgi:putative membrane protein